MVRTYELKVPLVLFSDFVRRKAQIFGITNGEFELKQLPFILELKFLILRYCNFIDRFRGLGTYIPQEGIPTSYSFTGFGIDELLRILNTFDEGMALITLNEMWNFTPGMWQYPTRQGHTYYPMTPEGFKREFRAFASLKFSQQRDLCIQQEGRVISVEEFLEYLIDCCIRFGWPLKKLIRSLIPEISSIGLTDYIMVRCANSAGKARRLHVILNRRGELFIHERPSEMSAPDIGTMCSFRMLF